MNDEALNMPRPDKSYKSASASLENQITSQPATCCLCAQIEGNQTNDLIANLLSGKSYVRRVMLESESFAVIPSLGPLADGHALLCTKKHLKSFASIFRSIYEEFQQVKKNLKMILSTCYGKEIYLFEHGMATKGDRTLCTVDHAHMHFVPLPQSFDMTAAALHRWIQFDGSLAALQKLSKGYEYIFFESQDGICHLLTGQDRHIESQYMRKVIANGLGHGIEWNWREAPDALAADETFRQLSQVGDLQPKGEA